MDRYKEPWVFHGFAEHPLNECKNCDDCIETQRAFEEFKKTDEYNKLINE